MIKILKVVSLMGFFGPDIYKKKNGEQWWLHSKKRGKVTLYYFSKDMVGAEMSFPKGYEIIENEKTGLPLLKKLDKKKEQKPAKK